MTGGRGPRNKGFGFEREIVKLALEAGLKARRLWGSNGATAGLPEGVDVVLGERDEWRLQAKRFGRIASYLNRPAGTDGVVVREDHGEPLAVIPFTTFLTMVRGGIPDGRQDDVEKQRAVCQIPGPENDLGVGNKGDRSLKRGDGPVLRHGPGDRNSQGDA